MSVDWWTRSRLDRVEPNRTDPDWIAGQWDRPETRVVRLNADGDVFTDEDHTSLRLAATSEDFDPARHLLVGLADDVPYFTVEALPDGPTASLRAVSSLLDETLRDIATAAVALHNWHNTAPYCGVCGGYSEVRDGGHMRVCTQCGRQRFPRTDPAMIVAVTDPQDRLLLARPSTWAPRRMSLVAGFVEAGECLEQTVVREVSEEVGLAVRDVRYVASQSWPFPRSLMVGFHALADDPGFEVDHNEVESARWFSREEMTEALATGDLSLPGEASIAYRIITLWRAGPL